MYPNTFFLSAVTTMAGVSEDECIRRKLLIEGDGGQDDRRITNLLKTFLRWYNSENGEESDDLARKIESQLALCEFSVEKSVLVYNMNKAEEENYTKLNKSISKQIDEGYAKISECKNELVQAKRIRKNRQEYDALAKVIQQQPDRAETLRKIDELNAELESLKTSKESLHKKLDLRKKQFHVLITAIHEMQSILAEDEMKESIMDTE